MEITDLIARLADDARLRPSHVSLCIAMIFCGTAFADAAVLGYAKVSLATFYRCLRDLRAWGYFDK